MGGRGSTSSMSASGGAPAGRGIGGGGLGSFNLAPQQQNQPAAPVVAPQAAAQQPDNQQPNVVPTAQQAQNLNNQVFSATDNSPYHNLYNGQQYYAKQNLSIDQRLAVMNYLSDAKESGTMYSMSQNMNHAMATGQKLTANQQFVHDNLMGAMHNIGYNVNLTRYDHSDVLDNMLAARGVRNTASNMTAAQLKTALVGHTYGENRFLSTSYNDFKNASNADTFTTREVRFEYRVKANVQAMMPGNGPGGRLGEVVLAPTSPQKNMRIVDVRDDKSRRTRSKGMSPGIYNNNRQIVVVVEVG